MTTPTKDIAHARRESRRPLREMDGEPVWNDTVKKWVLVDLFCKYGERTVDAGSMKRSKGHGANRQPCGTKYGAAVPAVRHLPAMFAPLVAGIGNGAPPLMVR